MWLALLLVIGIILCIAGLIWGTLWVVVPLLLLAVIGVVFQFTVLRSDVDSTGRLEKGPLEDEGRGHPEDTPDGPRHASTGYAHGGQGHMTP